MNEGIWVRSQDRATLIFVRTFEVWKSGTIVARFGENYKWLGSYKEKNNAEAALDMVENFINTPVRDKDIYDMPTRKEVEDYIKDVSLGSQGGDING